MTTMTQPALTVVAGVDTHADSHTAAVLDQLGRQLGHRQFPATAAGCQQMLGWLTDHGTVSGVGVEGTGSYGAGLTRHLQAAGIPVWEINRPDRSTRRARGKSDPIDADAAARTLLAGRQAGPPRAGDGAVAALRVLHTTRASAVRQRTATINAFHQAVITGPDELREQLQSEPKVARIRTAAALRPGPNRFDVLTATKTALRRLARRIQAFDDEIAEADADLDTLTRQIAPALREQHGVGPETAAQLLITAGGNPDRLTSEAAFAALCGTNPVPASSGKTTRHRLNRGGDRQANRALHVIAVTRMARHQRTRDYVARRRQNHSNPEILRCLKRCLARTLFPLIKQTFEPQQQPQAA